MTAMIVAMTTKVSVLDAVVLGFEALVCAVSDCFGGLQQWT